MTAPTTGERECVLDFLADCINAESEDKEAAAIDAFVSYLDALRLEIARVTAQLATAQREAAGLREENVRMRDAVRALLDLPAYQAWERLIMKNTPAPEAGR